jgi:predicted Ser/Thr protein kinase
MLHARIGLLIYKSMENQLIGSYRILQKIGAGGMAKVYLAVHQDVPNLKVILKVLSDSRLVERFKQEADKLALLDGIAGVCRIKHFFQHGEDIVIAMEFIDGVTVDEMIKGEGKLSLPESLRIAREVMSVLELAHEKGIYHRDIKPSNVMVDKKGNVKVIDFGIAKCESDPSLTVAGTACGTPAYMAPEQFTPTETTNYAAVDIYAVGTTLYYMLSGQLPFKGDNEFAIRDAKLFTDPPRLKTLVKNIPKQLDELVMRSLAKNPSDRFASVTEMIKATAHVTPAEVDQTPTVGIHARKEKGPSSSYKWPAVAAAVAAIAIGGYFIVKPGQEPAAIAPRPLSPADGATVATAQPTLAWEQTARPNETYTVEFADNAEFTSPTRIADLTTANCTIDRPLTGGRYFWRVQTAGAGHKAGPFSNTFSLTLALPSAASPQGDLKVTVSPSGDIYVDNQVVRENSPEATLKLDTGYHDLVVRNNAAAEKKEFSDRFHVTADTTIALSYHFALPARAKPTEGSTPSKPAGRHGELRVGSKPLIGATVYIDGELQRRTTPSAFNLRPGEHIVRATLLIDGQTKERVDTVAVVADSSAKVIFDFEN